jgi:glutamate:Na+ symporter, ESS family
MLMYAILAASAVLLVGIGLRSSVRVFRTLYLPASVLGGLIAFGLVQALMRGGVPEEVAAVAAGIAKEWAGWPTVLIAVVFAALLLEGSDDPAGGGLAAALQRGARSGLLAWIIIIGQIVIGLTVYLVAVRPSRPDVPATFGQLLEVSWAGGHGASSGMGAIYASQGFAEGRDLAFFLATFGLIYGVLSGLVLVNIAVRRGWTAAKGATAVSDAAAAGEAKRGSISLPALPGVESLAIQVVLLAMAFAIGLGLQRAFIAGSEAVFGADNPEVRGEVIDGLGNVPLFLFTLLGGAIVRGAMRGLGLMHLISTDAIRAIVGVAMEFLIVAAIATIQLEALTAFWTPVILLIVLAAAWSTFCLLVLARRILPRAYWFELGLLNYGFSTANTPQGFMLLRIVDPELRTRAAEDYAVAAPLSAPFVGGGILTFGVLPLVLARAGAAPVLVGCVVLLSALVAVGMMISRGGRRGD